MVPEQVLAQAARQAGLRLLVLFGSRVLGHSHGQSDWDFGYLASRPLDRESLRGRLMEIPERLTRAAGFRNAVAHAYEDLDMARVHRSAMQGPADLRAFLAAMATLAAARKPPQA